MHKRQRIEWLVLLTAMCANADAGEELAITGFDATEVEIHQDGEYRYLDSKALGQPPIAVLDRDKRNFLKIRLPGGELVWVNGGDVRTSDLENLRHNCSGLAMSEPGDRKQYGMRGVGEKCK
jgi:hypothetical protein